MSRANVLGTRAEADETRGNCAQKWKPKEQSQRERQLVALFGFASGYDVSVNERLHSLDQTGRPFPALLHFFQFGDCHRAIS